jgi:hypothetical protein
MALICLVGATGCNPILHSASSAPVRADAELHRPLFENDRIELSRGVALAVDCYAAWFWGPCEDMRVSTDDPSIATAHIAHLEKYRSPYDGHVYEERRQRSALVLAAQTPGRTKLRITSDDGDRTLDVVVRE